MTSARPEVGKVILTAEVIDKGEKVQFVNCPRKPRENQDGPGAA